MSPELPYPQAKVKLPALPVKPAVAHLSVQAAFIVSPAQRCHPPVSGWQAAGGKIDATIARDHAVEFARKFEPRSHISQDEERELRAIIRRVRTN